MELAVLDIKGKDTGKKVSLSEEVFGVEANDHVVYLDIKHYLANQRQGTHKSKERAEIVGSTKKLKKQKGTGTARAGSIKSPVFRGGGRVFGPKPRTYQTKLNKKVKALAKKVVLSDKVKAGAISVVNAFDLDAPSTKSYVEVLNNLSLAGSKVLLVLDGANKNVALSGRNIPKNKVTTVDSLVTYDLLNADKVVLLEGAIEKIENTLK